MNESHHNSYDQFIDKSSEQNTCDHQCHYSKKTIGNEKDDFISQLSLTCHQIQEKERLDKVSDSTYTSKSINYSIDHHQSSIQRKISVNNNSVTMKLITIKTLFFVILLPPSLSAVTITSSNIVVDGKLNNYI